MSATILAAKIVHDLRESPKNSPVNDEIYVRNLLIAFEIYVSKKVIEQLTEEIRP